MKETKLRKNGEPYINKPGAGRPIGTLKGRTPKNYAQVYFDDEISKKIKEKGEKEGKSFPTTIREIVNNFFKK